MINLLDSGDFYEIFDVVYQVVTEQNLGYFEIKAPSSYIDIFKDLTMVLSHVLPKYHLTAARASLEPDEFETDSEGVTRDTIFTLYWENQGDNNENKPKSNDEEPDHIEIPR